MSNNLHRSNMAKILYKLHIFRNLGNQVISMKITSNMSNNLIDTNIFGNEVTSMKTRSNMAKILNNLHIFRSFNNVTDINILQNQVKIFKFG